MRLASIKAGLIAIGIAMAAPASAETVIAVATFIEHPAVQALLKGLTEGLTKGGVTAANGYRIDLQSAQGSTVTATQIARKFAGDRPAVIVAAGTPIAQPMVQAITDIPIVFSGLADPVGAKIVKDLDHPGGNVTGTSDRAPFATLLDVMGKLVPAGKRVGLVYNAGEANSRALVDRFKGEAASRGYSFTEATVTKASDVLSAGQSLVGKVDLIYVPNDGTVVSNFEALGRVSTEAKLPVFASALDNAARGAVAATGIDYEQIGQRTAAIVLRVLKGETVGTIPVDLPKSLDVVLNEKIAKEIGLALPSDLLQSAKLVIR